MLVAVQRDEGIAALPVDGPLPSQSKERGILHDGDDDRGALGGTWGDGGVRGDVDRAAGRPDDWARVERTRSKKSHGFRNDDLRGS